MSERGWIGSFERRRWACAAAGVLVLAMEAGSCLAGGNGLVERLRASGAEVMSLGRQGALDGWLVSPSGRSPYTLYVDDTGHGVMGLLFAPDGAGMTEEQVAAAQQGGAPDMAGPVERSAGPVRASRIERAWTASGPAPARMAFDAASMGEGFELGQEGPQVAIFADPSCLPSRAAVAELARRALKGELRLRVVPVGARGAEAEAMAGAVLGSEDRALAWLKGGRDGDLREPVGDVMGAVALNRLLFERTGSEFVPYVLMRGADATIRSAVGLDFRNWFREGEAN